MGFNKSNFTNTTSDHSSFSYDDSHYQTITKVFYTMEILFTVVGTLLNLWFLVAILTSREMRSRLRNKIICNTLVLQLLDSAFIFPVSIGMSMSRQTFSCTVQSAFANLELIQDFIANWLLVIILVVFIAQIQDFNPRMRLTPMAITLGTVGLLVLPWVASLVVVPIIVHEYYFSLKLAQAGCSYPTQDAIQLFKSIDTAVPILLAVLLLIAAVALRFRRFTRGYTSGSMRVELISRGPEIDSPVVYIVAVAVSSACDILRLIHSLDTRVFYSYSMATWINLIVAAWIMSDARVFLMPLPWLLLTDVRQRIRTWRPWYRPAYGIDLTVAYTKEEN